MTTYLTIITTVLVLTQIARVTQNAIHLMRVRKTLIENEYVISVWQKIEKYIDSKENE